MLSLPIDVIHYELFPFLEHSSRIEFNRILPHQERKPTPLKEDVVAEFSALYSKCMVQRLMTTMKRSNQREFLKACRSFDHQHIKCLRHFSTFRKKFMRVLTEILNRLSDRPSQEPQVWGFITKYMKKEINMHVNTFFAAAGAAFNSVTPKIRFQDEFSVTGAKVHTVIKLPQYDFLTARMNMLDMEMEEQLQMGRAMMAFWTSRGDFLGV